MPVDAYKSESALIARLRRELVAPAAAGRPARPGSGWPLDFVDDMAAIDSGPAPLLWTVDMLMEGVDFDSGRHSWYQIGRKAMAASLSDCAAMAVRPLCALCAVALNNCLSLEDAVTLHRGAHDCGIRFGCPVVGGDTNSWQAPTVVSVSVAARTEPGLAPVCRDGARPGDLIALSGPVGGSILGRHLSFEPRIELALSLRRRVLPHAMIDVSDGLALDLWRVLEASGCGATLEAPLLEALIHPDAIRLSEQDGRPAREHALYDGEDFELIAVLPAKGAEPAFADLGFRLLGRIEAEPGLRLREADGRTAPIERRGWEHFR